MNIINIFIDDFCEELDIERRVMESKSRKRIVVEKRMLLSYFLRVKIKLTYEEVGVLLNKKHCTIMYHVNKIEDFLIVYPHVRRMYQKAYSVYERYIDLYQHENKDFYSQLLDENARLCARLSVKEKQIKTMGMMIAKLENYGEEVPVIGSFDEVGDLI